MPYVVWITLLAVAHRLGARRLVAAALSLGAAGAGTP